MSGPLAGVRVLDFSQALSGPYAAMLLGDMGAGVIKVEPPHGDMLRGSGPFVGAVSLYYLATNRNKRSVALDLKAEGAAEVVAALAKDADVVIENFRPGVADRIGISYEAVAKINPRIVHLAISGYGSSGPMSHWGGFDQVAQGVGGLMSVTGTEMPTRVGIPVADVLAGAYGALGVVAALHRRDDTGKGESVETSLLASVVASLGVVGQEYLSTARIPGLARNDHPVLYPYGVFEAVDGVFNLGVAHDAMWRRLCSAIDADDLANDARYATNDLRVAARDELRERLNGIFRTRTRGAWTDYLNESGIPAGPVNTLAEVFAEEQVRQQDLVVTLNDPEAGEVEMLGSPLRFGAGIDAARAMAPRLGEHSREILEEAGLPGAEIDRLITTGAIIDGDRHV
jgi:crotonobetainyl-CoA:carnitine CoA-transferase CaiB-like acyl-CoA transferase